MKELAAEKYLIKMIRAFLLTVIVFLLTFNQLFSQTQLLREGVLFSDSTVQKTAIDTGQSPGDMLYWNGSKWLTVPAGSDGQVLTFFGGVPSWINVESLENSSCGSVVLDIDGHAYNVVRIGGQCWMKENLKVGHFNNSDPLSNVTDNATWNSTSSNAWADYDNNTGNDGVFGKLYNWYAINDSRGLCPSGWHVPTDDDWKTLEMYLGMNQASADSTGFRGTDEGGKMKAYFLWTSPNTGATDTSGFSAIPGGYRDILGYFQVVYTWGNFWTSTDGGGSNAWFRGLTYDKSQISRVSGEKRNGFSCRCVKN